MSEVFLTNDLLSYLRNSLDLGREDISIIIQNCATFYTVSEICKAKAQLCEALNISAKCVPHRTGDEKGKKSLQDIIKSLKEIDRDSLPKFSASEPPWSTPDTLDQNVDVARMQKDIATLQASLEDFKQKFEVSQNTIAELRAEVVSLRNTVIGSNVTSNFVDNVRRDVPAAGESYASAASAPSADSPKHGSPRVAKRTDQPPAPRRNIANRQAHPPSVPAANKMGKARTTTDEPPRNKRSDQVDAEGFTLVQKKRSKRQRTNKCGIAPVEPNQPLRAATPRTSLYVSRLHASTTKQDVLDYIFARHKAGVFKDSPRLGVFVEALESRYVLRRETNATSIVHHHLILHPTFIRILFTSNGITQRSVDGCVCQTVFV
ncbi:hypothetical protein NE865_02646 [Phthorimaea operculella]|nr:hypothetical protein NE865_02646 [Phthorimaea operculella]